MLKGNRRYLLIIIYGNKNCSGGITIFLWAFKIVANNVLPFLPEPKIKKWGWFKILFSFKKNLTSKSIGYNTNLYFM